MKKKLIYGLTCISISILLTGCHMKHEWVEATCTEPRTCSIGGETQGEALGHEWVEATCTQPKTCSVCGETEGDALGHEWVEATYDAPKTCSLCGLTEGEPLPQPYADANGLEFFQGTSFITKGTRYDKNMPEESYETIDAEVDITGITVEDAESEGEQTITIVYTVKGRITYEKPWIIVPHFTLWDIYTGRMVPSVSISENGQASFSIEFEWDGKTYFIEHEKYSWWERYDWMEDSDGNETREMENCLVEIVTVPKDYDGLALFMGDEDKYRELNFGTDGEDDGGTGGSGTENYVLDVFEEGNHLILVEEAYEMLNK